MKQIEKNVSNPHLSPLERVLPQLTWGWECMAGQGSGLNRGKVLAPSQIKTLTSSRRRLPRRDRERLVCIVSLITISYRLKMLSLLNYSLSDGRDMWRCPPPPSPHTGVATILHTRHQTIGVNRSLYTPWQPEYTHWLTCLNEAEDKEGRCQGEEKLWVHDGADIEKAGHHVWLCSDTR